MSEFLREEHVSFQGHLFFTFSHKEHYDWGIFGAINTSVRTQNSRLSWWELAQSDRIVCDQITGLLMPVITIYPGCWAMEHAVRVHFR